MKLAIYPGTFDPITNGHIDIIRRAVSICEKVKVGVVKMPGKSTLFSYAERLALVQAATKGIRGVSVTGFDGLVVDFARKNKARVIVRGIRMISDFEYEFQMALTNRNLCPEVETIFLMPSPDYSYISSRLIKEAAFLGADLKRFLPVSALRALKDKLQYESSARKTK